MAKDRMSSCEEVADWWRLDWRKRGKSVPDLADATRRLKVQQGNRFIFKFSLKLCFGFNNHHQGAAIRALLKL